MNDVSSRLSAALADRYRLERQLGEGGMATVYLADDLKHDRKVAIKVLKAELAQMLGKDRFLAEIKTTANLQHPHILPLFDSGEADGFLFYAMPYVEGETLGERLAREVQLPVDQSLDLIRKVASALDYAHQQGIVHRDLKPGNILLSSGEPLVADFGIALAVHHAGESRMTQTGLSMGTPHYMSPEQASGDRSLDPRSDVYALGCVLYEMLSGDPPFSGSNAQAILARILTTLPSRVTVQRPTVPPHVDAAIARSLEKIPADRFATAADFRKALDDPSFRHSTVSHIETRNAAPVVVRRKSGPIVPVLGIALVFALVMAAVGWLRPEPVTGGPSQRYRIELDLGSTGGSPALAISPDGRRLAHVGAAGLQVRSTSALDSRVIPVSDLVRSLVFSPDGEAIAFTLGAGTDDGVAVVQLDGGTPIVVAAPDGGVSPWNAWSEDGFIYFVSEDGELLRVPESGGDIEPALPALGSREPFFLASVPGYPGLLLGATLEEDGSVQLNVFDIPADRVIPIEEIASGLAPLFAGGMLFWVAPNRDLMARPFDPERAAFMGPATTLAQGVVVGNVAISNSGVAIFRALGSVSETQSGRSGENLGWLDRSGEVTPLDDRLAQNVRDFDGLALSPDENFIVTSVQVGEDMAEDRSDRILVYDVAGESWFYLTLLGERNFLPRWRSQDRVAFITDLGERNLIRSQRYDRTDEPETLFETEAYILSFSVADAGRTLVVALEPTGRTPDLDQGIYLVDAASGDMTPFLTAPYQHFMPEVSPDGRWIAYVSVESGRPELFVQAFPDRSRPYPISAGEGYAHRWSRDGTELFYLGEGGVFMSARLDFTEGVRVAERENLFSERPRFELSRGEAGALFDVSERQGLLAIVEAVGSSGTGMLPTVITDVFREMSDGGSR
jgi:tRNA A-37 threonylcarbamoyl transferase component Bud32